MLGRSLRSLPTHRDNPNGVGLYAALCNEHLTLEPHVCDPEKIRAYVKRLEDEARIAEKRLDDVRNAVYKVLQTLPSLEGESATIKTEDLRRLWDAADCRWHEAKTADSFLVCWIATHRILCEAFDLFRSKKYGKVETTLQKLQALREACDSAKKVLGHALSWDNINALYEFCKLPPPHAIACEECSKKPNEWLYKQFWATVLIVELEKFTTGQPSIINSPEMAQDFMAELKRSGAIEQAKKFLEERP